MNNASPGLVGNSFKLGYRFQRYWDTSMALAFFSAETGAGLFAVSACFGLMPGMIAGLLLVSTLKPYFHLAHMGVPKKSWRAITRPDRSWISRGVIGIALLIGFGILHLWLHPLNTPLGTAIEVIAIAAAVLVMCYQGMAMAHSESFALWATPLLPLSSVAYAATAGTMLTWLLGTGRLGIADLSFLKGLALALLVLDLAVVAALMLTVRHKSRGGAFSVDLLLRGEYAGKFIGLVVVLGLLAPLLAVALSPAAAPVVVLAAATLAMLAGFLAFRILVFKAAVFEPIAADIVSGLAASLLR